MPGPSRGLERDPEFLSKIITGDEMLVYRYDSETIQQSPQWKGSSSSCVKKARQVCSNVKSMITVFFDIQGVVHYEFVPQGRTVNQHYYTDTLQCLWENVWQNQPEKWNCGDWFLHHDNTPAHSALSVHAFRAKNTNVLSTPSLLTRFSAM
jgi:hypothetical protein